MKDQILEWKYNCEIYLVANKIYLIYIVKGKPLKIDYLMNKDPIFNEKIGIEKQTKLRIKISTLIHLMITAKKKPTQ